MKRHCFEMPSITDPKAISNFISCTLAFALQQSQMISVNWEVIPDGLTYVYDLFFSPLAVATTLLFSSANIFHVFSLNSEPSLIHLRSIKKHGRTCHSYKTNCACGKQQTEQLILSKYEYSKQWAGSLEAAG